MAKNRSSGPLTIQDVAKRLNKVGSYRHSLSSLFQDFVSVAAISLRNGFEPKTAAWEKRETEYLEIVGRYERDIVEAMSECLGTLILLARQGHSDHLGELYMALGTSKNSLGQFFTPYHISRMMASITLSSDGIDKAISDNGFVSVYEPTCGAGGMVVAAADVLSELGYDPARQLRVTAQDVDRHCCRMTYVNCVLHQIPATIIWGDALKLEQKEVVHTPALHLQLAEIQIAGVKDAA